VGPVCPRERAKKPAMPRAWGQSCTHIWSLLKEAKVERGAKTGDAKNCHEKKKVEWGIGTVVT